MFSRIFGRKPTPSLDSVKFDASGYSARGDKDGCRVWFTAEGDGLGLYCFPVVPDLPADVVSAGQLEAFYRERYAAQGIRVVDVDLIGTDGVVAVKTIFKVRQKPSGLTYLASLTIPFAEFSFVLKLQCQEHGTTGMKETALLIEAQSSGAVRIDAGKIVGDWDPENRRHDSRFPTHPLSRARRALAQLQHSVKIDEGIKTATPFFKKAQLGASDNPAARDGSR